MNIPSSQIQFTYCVLAAIAAALVFASRLMRSAERRVLSLMLSILLVTVMAILYAGHSYGIEVDLVIAIILIELGLFAYVYDAYRTFRSTSKNLRNMGSIYIFIGLCLLLSRSTHFPAWPWIIPVVFLSLGYFFFRRRKGLAAFSKGAGILISVGFIASMIYDVKEGAVGRPEVLPLRERVIPEIVKPSIVEDLNTLNEKISVLEEQRASLTSELASAKTENRDLKVNLKRALESKAEVDGKLLQAEKARMAAEEESKQLKAEVAAIKSDLTREQAQRTQAEAKVAEYDKAKEAAKESFSNFEEQLNKAVQDLKKTVKERDELKAELESVKAAAATAPSAQTLKTLEAQVQSLKQELAQKEAERAKLDAELVRANNTLKKIREALAAPAESALPGNP